MASNINLTNIDTAYPIAGQDNDSQGFRDNFTNINSNFAEAKTEIEALQADVLAIEAGQAVTLSLGTVSDPVVVDVDAATYQTMTLGESINLSFINFPASGTQGVVQLEVTVTNIAYTLTLPAAVTIGIEGMPGIVGQVVNFSTTGVYIFEFASASNGAIISVHNLTPGPDAGISNIVEDTTPQLGGDLDVNGQSIVSTAAGDIAITPDTTGNVVLDGLNWPQADGTADQVLKTDGLGQLAWVDQSTTVSTDATPSLGGDLDVSGQSIVSTSNGNINLTADGTGTITIGSTSAGITVTTGASVPDSGYDFTNGASPYLVEVTKGTASVTYGTMTSDGSKIVWNDNSGANPKTVHIMDLSTPWDLSTAGVKYTASYTGGSINGGLGIFQFNADGTKMFSSYLPEDTIWEYTLGTPYDVDTAGTGTESSSLWGGSGITDGGYCFTPDGLNLYSVNDLGGAAINVRQWTLGTAWDVTTIPGTPTSSIDLYSQTPAGNRDYYLHPAVSADGTKLFLGVIDGGFVDNYVLQFDMTANDASTLTYNAGIGVVTFNLNTPSGGSWRRFSISPDGTHAFNWYDNYVVSYDISAGDGSAGATSSSLYYDNAVTLATTADGVAVTGQLALSNYATGSLPTGVEGGVAYDTTTNELKYYDGTSWTASPKEYATSYGTSGAQALDLSAGTWFYPTGTATGAITFSFSNPKPSGQVSAFTLELSGALANAPVWPASVVWPDNHTEPTWTAGPDIVSFISRDGGATWYGMLGGTSFVSP